MGGSLMGLFGCPNFPKTRHFETYGKTKVNGKRPKKDHQKTRTHPPHRIDTKRTHNIKDHDNKEPPNPTPKKHTDPKMLPRQVKRQTTNKIGTKPTKRLRPHPDDKRNLPKFLADPGCDFGFVDDGPSNIEHVLRFRSSSCFEHVLRFRSSSSSCSGFAAAAAT